MARRENDTSGRSLAGQQISVEWADSYELSEEIRGLFREEGREEVFEKLSRIYPVVRKMGGGSVVGRDPSRSPVIHTPLFARTFRSGERLFRGALLGGMVVRERYQDFWTPVAFLRRALELPAIQHEFDFLYADPGENGAALVRAATFELKGSLQLYFFPLVPGWSAQLRRRFPVEELASERIPWREGKQHLEGGNGLDSGGAFQALRPFDLCQSWLGANEREKDTELLLLRPPSTPTTEPPVARVLTTPLPGHRTLAILDVAWRDRQVKLESLFHAVAHTARSSGYRKLATRTLGSSQLGRAMERCGFVEREDERPILTKGLTEDVRIPPADRWLLNWIDGNLL